MALPLFHPFLPLSSLPLHHHPRNLPTFNLLLCPIPCLISSSSRRRRRQHQQLQLCLLLPESWHLVKASAWAGPPPLLQQSHLSEEFPSSAMAIVAAVDNTCSSAVEFSQRVDKGTKGVFSGPSAEFLALCDEQLAICDRVFRHNAKITVYIRSADSYGTGHLEMRRVAGYPRWMLGGDNEILVLIGKFETGAALRTAETVLAEQGAVELPECKAVVLPIVKDLFVVGLLVAEWIVQRSEGDLKGKKMRPVRPSWPPQKQTLQAQEDLKAVKGTESSSASDSFPTICTFTPEQRAESANIARSLALACVMDQRALLLQQSSWQKGVRTGDLLEQVRGPLTAIRTLGKMLQPQLKRGEISSDIVDDILVQGDRMKDVIQQLQEVSVLVKSRPNVLSHNEFDASNNKGLLNGDSAIQNSKQIVTKKLDSTVDDDNDKQSDPVQKNCLIWVGHPAQRDREAPMPPVALAPLKHSETRPCNVSNLLVELVRSGAGLVKQRGQTVELKQSSYEALLLASVDESALRQALGTLLDSALQHTLPGGCVKVEAMVAPGGGVLVVIDDNGPDLSLMMQTYALAPFGSGLQIGTNVEKDGKTLSNIGVQLTVAQDIIEQFGGVLRITSPYLPNAPRGVGGTRLEIWLPAPPRTEDSAKFHQH